MTVSRRKIIFIGCVVCCFGWSGWGAEFTGLEPGFNGGSGRARFQSTNPAATISGAPDWFINLHRNVSYLGDGTYAIEVGWAYEKNWEDDAVTEMRTVHIGTPDGDGATVTQAGVDNTYVYQVEEADRTLGHLAGC